MGMKKHWRLFIFPFDLVQLLSLQIIISISLWWMFEKLVERILNRVLGEYVEGFNSENLKIGLWSGEVVIRNVSLKKQVIKQLNLPLVMKYSRLGCLKLNIPWKSLTSSKIDVVVEGLELLISEVPESQWNCKNVRIIEHRKEQMQAYCEAIINDFAKKTQKGVKEQEEEGYFSKMIIKVIDNIQVVIRDIHIRYQDQITNCYSFGVTLEELKIQTVNAKGDPEFIDRSKPEYQEEPLRKNLILSNLGVYWNEQSELFQPEHCHERMLESIARRGSVGEKKLNYLILMTSNAQLLQRQAGKQFMEPEINLVIGIEQLRIEVSKQQLQQIVALAQRLQKYAREVKAQNRRKLTQLEMIANRQLFLQLFPKYFEKTISAGELEAMEKILEKMEVSVFQDGIKQYLQGKQKEKMIEQKKQASRGWFSGPKELTDNEKKEIEEFVYANFGDPAVEVKRPKDFYYIRVNFVLSRLEFIVANSNPRAQTKDGIRSRLEDIQVDFSLRTGGYQLNFGIWNFEAEIFNQQMRNPSSERIVSVIKKISNELKTQQTNKYINLTVLGSPLNKPGLDTEVILKTEELLFIFDPQIVEIALKFADIKVSSENTEAAFEAYGEIKNKTANLTTQSLETPKEKKSFVSINATVSSMTLILFFDPSAPQKDIWALRLGQIYVYTDPSVLGKSQFTFDEAMEKYCMQLSQISMDHHESKSIYLSRRANNEPAQPESQILSDLSVDFSVQLFQRTTEEIPKIRGKAIMHSLSLNISEFTYTNLQKLSNCFVLAGEPIEVKQIQEQKKQQKSTVMKNAKKIGVIWEQSKEPQKYICVLNGGYLYFYADKKDVEYADYRYVRHCTFEFVGIPEQNEKPFTVKLVNSVGKVSLGFDKQETMNGWVDAIRSLQEDDYKITAELPTEKDKQQKTHFQKPNPNVLNFQVEAQIEQIGLTTMLRNQKSINIIISNLSTHLKLHETKTTVDVSLKAIELKDDIYPFKSAELAKLLYSQSLEGENKLINIHMLQLASRNPDYQLVDSEICVKFGKLILNYKPGTVESIMRFFMPPQSQEPKLGQPIAHEAQESQRELKDQKRKRLALKILSDIFLNQPERFAIKANIMIQEIAISLINQKNKVMFSKLGLTGLTLTLGQSTRKMSLQGSLRQLWMQDLSNYPYTVVEQQQLYDDVHYLLNSNCREREMMDFNIQILQIPNEAGKRMLIKTNISHLKVCFVQQPVLRLLTYLTEQMLPSLTPQAEPSSTVSADRVPLNDSQPQESEIDIDLKLSKIVVVIEPRSGLEESLTLELKCIGIQNRNIYRQWIDRDPEGKSQQQVLVQQYNVDVRGVNIEVKYQNTFSKLTNDLDIEIGCDLITNPAYYHKRFGTHFQAGMRLKIHLTPFLMRINHDDYNFIMKCLFWSIAYDDNAEGYMFDGAAQKTDDKGVTIGQQSEPIYLLMNIDKIAMCVTQNSLPITVLLLDQMQYTLKMDESGMKMNFTLHNLSGTNIHQTDNPSISKEIGLFNAFGYIRQLNTEQLYQIESLVKLVSRDDPVYSEHRRPVVEFLMDMSPGDMLVDLKIDALTISVELKNLLVLSKLALMEDNIQPPKPRLKAVNKKPDPPQNEGTKMNVVISMSNFVASVCDNKGKNFVVIEGAVMARLLMLPTRPESQVIEALKNRVGQIKMASHSVSVTNLCLYFCNMKREGRRYLMDPLNIGLNVDQQFSEIEGKLVHLTEVLGTLDKVIIQASVRDMLKLSVIAQDNLNKFSEVQEVPQEPKLQQKDSVEISSLKQEVVIDDVIVQKAIKEVQQAIIRKTKAAIKLSPLQVKIINDCDNNFLPVINLLMEESTLLFRSDPTKAHFSQQNITVRMDFFNPLSSDWEPVLETFRVSLDYLNLVHQFGQEGKIIISSSEVEELSEIKVNVSTQFLASLMATLQIANIEQKKITKVESASQIEVSPYTLHNLTYEPILIYRLINNESRDIKLPPLYRGPVRLADHAEILAFSIGSRHQISLGKLGITKIKPGFYAEFSADKLNRVIKIVEGSLIKNNTKSDLYCLRHDRNCKRIDPEALKIQPQEVLPVPITGCLQLSFNGDTYTKITFCKQLETKSQLVAESEKFKLAIIQRRNRLGHFVFHVWPAFVINNCLPQKVTIGFIKMGKTVSTREIEACSSYEVFANENIYHLRFTVSIEGFNPSREFGADATKEGSQQVLNLTDRNSCKTSLKYVIEKKKNRNMYHLNIYCSAYIVSELDFRVAMYGSLARDEKNRAMERYYLLGGQQRVHKSEQPCQETQEITLIGAQTGQKVRICGYSCLVDFSEPIVISGLGVNEARIVTEQVIDGKTMHLFTLIGVDISLKKMMADTEIFTREIILRSRSIMLNNTGLNFRIKEEGCERYVYMINKNERKPFYFSFPRIKDRARGLVMQAEGLRESVAVFCDSLGSVHFRLQHINQNQYSYFKVHTQEIKTYKFYDLSQVDYKDLPYQVLVKTEKLEVSVPLFNRVVQKNSEPLLFINERPSSKFLLQLQIKSKNSSRIHDLIVEVDNLKFREQLTLIPANQNEPTIRVLVYIIFNDSKKIIVINEKRQDSDDQPEYDIQTINAKFEKLSISFIVNHVSINRPYEAFYFYLHNLEFLQKQTNKRTKYQTRLQFLQLDQNEPFNMANPVIITPHRYKEFVNSDPKAKTKSIFNALIEIDNSFVKNMFINTIAIDVNNLTLHADTNFIRLMLSIYQDITEILNTRPDYEHSPQRQVNTWRALQIVPEGSKTFIKSIKIAPFTMGISVEVRLNELDTESVIFFGTVINALGVVLTNIEDAPIFFNGIVINDCVDTIEGLNQKLMNHYKSSVMGQLYKVFGSLNIIGNPVSLFNNISTGFKDLKDKPREGFVEGPLEFGMGLAQGTSSLIAHSVGGALNSVEKVTGTIASGLAVLTFDKQFEEMREKQKMKKPKHVFDGLEKGGKAVFHGFKEGITGLFTKPYENTKKEGVIGFFKGAAQGVTGMVVKPVTGVVDFASKTTEGLKNTALYLEDKPNQNRIRYPRVFYTELSLTREYSPFDSKLFAVINKTRYEDKYGFQNTLFIETFMITNRAFLLLLMEDVAMIRIDEQKIEWAIPIENCECRPEGEKLRIRSTTKRQWYSNKIDETVKFRTQADQLRFEKLLKELRLNKREKEEDLKYSAVF